MTTATPATARPVQIWTGRILIGLSGLFMLFDSVLHLLKPQPVVDAFTQLAYPLDVSVALGMIQLLCLILYVVPRTAVLGAILLTAYLGGAIATNLRVGNPLFSHTLFPAYAALLLWGGLYLTDARLRELIPLRRT